MCVSGFLEEIQTLNSSFTHPHTHGFSLCFGFVTNIAKRFVFDVFPLNSDTNSRRMFDLLFLGDKCRKVCFVFE